MSAVEVATGYYDMGEYWLMPEVRLVPKDQVEIGPTGVAYWIGDKKASGPEPLDDVGE